AHAFADGDEAAAALAIDRVDVGEKLVLAQRRLRDVNQMRPVAVAAPREDRGGGEEAGVAPHDHIDLDAGQAPVVVVVAHYRGGDELGRRAVAGRVVVDAEVIVDRLGDVIDGQAVAV